MARQRCSPAIFIVCSLLLLATVITAFRLRDLTPRSPAERQVSSRRNPLLENGEECDSDSDNQKHASASALKVKEIASRRTYEDVKKAVKEKQQTLNEKKLQEQRRPIQRYLHEDSDDEDDDDDEDEDKPSKLTKVHVGTQTQKTNTAQHVNFDKHRKVPPTVSQKAIKSTSIKSVNTLPKLSLNDLESDSDSDDEDENDKDDDEDDEDKQFPNDDDKSDDKDDDEDDSDDEDVSTDDEEIQSQSQTFKKISELAKNIIPKQKQSDQPHVDLNKIAIIKKLSSNEDESDDEDDDINVKPIIKTQKIDKKPTETPKQSPQDSKVDRPESLKTDHSVPLKEKNQVLPAKKPSSTQESKPPLTVLKPSPTSKKEYDKEEMKKEHNVQKEIKQDHKSSQHDDKNAQKEHESISKKETIAKKTPEKEVQKKIETHPTKPITEPKNNVKKDSTEKKQTEAKPHQAKEKLVLQHASEALYRKNFLQSEFEDFYAFLPSFAPNFTRIHNPECRRQGQILMRQLRGTRPWALNMLDASAKIPSGILQGNGNQLGDFDQCLASRARVRLDSGHVVHVQGKYCLAQVDLRADLPELQLPTHMAQARNLIKSKIDDPGHFIPRFSSLNWGVCLPAACGADEAEFVLRDALRHYQLAGLQLRVNVDPLNCHAAPEDWWDAWFEPPTLATVLLLSCILLMVVYATLKDVLASRSDKDSETCQDTAEEEGKADDEKPEEEATTESNRDQNGDGVVSAFSLRRCWSRLTRAGDAEDIACIHGVRALCSLALLLAHKIIPVANTPYVNRSSLTELSHTALSYPLRLGWLYTDAFLLLSGALSAHRLSADVDAAAPVPWLRRYLARYFRLTPALLCVLLFYAYVWELVGAGPQWGTLVSHNARLCQESWWCNVLYVQNFFAFDEMCAPQTYQLALDMQLTLVAAALVWLMRRRPLSALGVMVTLLAAAAYARYSATAEHRLSLLIYHGVSVSQLYRTARLSYTSALHRATPYVAGLALGVLLQRRRGQSLSKFVLVPCWALFACCCAGAVLGVADAAAPDARYSAASAAAYAALAPLAAAAALSWLIFAAHSGHANWLNQLLCARPLVLISRLSYALYLIQFLVFFTNAATTRTATEFTLLSILDMRELVTLFAVSTALTLTVVIPMQSLSKYVMTYEFGSKEEITEESQENAEVDASDAPYNNANLSMEPIEEAEDEIEEVVNINGQRIIAHRELLEEILEAEVEYESQRDSRDEGLEEILEEEEDELLEEEAQEEEAGEEEMEILDGEELDGGEDDFWGDREEDYVPRRASRLLDRDAEWEWTSEEQDSSAMNHRYEQL